MSGKNKNKNKNKQNGNNSQLRQRKPGNKQNNNKKNKNNKKDKNERQNGQNGKSIPLKSRSQIKLKRVSFLPRYYFIPLLLVRILSALVNIISDCDETFNYWEPTAFLLTDYGFQTWEYSAQYSLRSYLYLFPQYAFGRLLFTFGFSNLTVFYGIRILLSLFCFVGEYYFIQSLNYWFDKGMICFVFIFFVFFLFGFGCFLLYYVTLFVSLHQTRKKKNNNNKKNHEK